jgi:ribosome maturation factor RimP
MNASSRQNSPRAGVRSAPAAAGPADASQLAILLGPVVSAAGLDLENVRITAAGRRRLLRIVVDGDGGVTLDAITQISRALSAELDANGAMGEAPYTLEVSSPGAERPLTEPRHWRRAAGRLVRVPLLGAKGPAPKGPSPKNPASKSTAAKGPAAVEGRVLSASETGVVLEVAGQRREFGYAELGQGKILLEFGHVAEADGGDSDGH